jgi:5'-methylthioadenosine phosphorylase
MIGIIGGSGFYAFFSNSSTRRQIKTPFGEVSVIEGVVKEKKVYFLPRHGLNHHLPPHKIEYKANVFALQKVGVTHILATSAVGAILPELKPGDFVLPDQFIDFTSNHPKTFFDGDFTLELPSGEKKNGVVHTDYTQPYSPYLRDKIQKIVIEMNISLHPKGVYVCTNGPRFETPAEIRAFKILGGTIVGMTSATECILSKELGMNYASLCIVTNYAAGLQEKITDEEVFELMDDKIEIIKEIFYKTIVII